MYRFESKGRASFRFFLDGIIASMPGAPPERPDVDRRLEQCLACLIHRDGSRRREASISFLHVWLLECITNSFEATFVAPVGESLINVVPVAEKSR